MRKSVTFTAWAFVTLPEDAEYPEIEQAVTDKFGDVLVVVSISNVEVVEE